MEATKKRLGAPPKRPEDRVSSPREKSTKSISLPDSAWELLGEIANRIGCNKNDVVEALMKIHGATITKEEVMANIVKSRRPGRPPGT